MRLGRKIVIILGLFCLFLVTGCGKPGESMAEDFVKEHVKVKESYKKVSYDYKTDAKVSRLVYRAKNLMGVELEGKVYFSVPDDKKIICIGEDSIAGTNDVFEKKPEQLEAYSAAVSQFRKVMKEKYITIQMYQQYLESISKNGSLHDNYFGWKEAYIKQEKYNEAVQVVHTAWNSVTANSTPEAIDSIKRTNEYEIYDAEKCIKAKKVKVDLEGNSFLNWSGKFSYIKD